MMRDGLNVPSMLKLKWAQAWTVDRRMYESCMELVRLEVESIVDWPELKPKRGWYDIIIPYTV